MTRSNALPLFIVCLAVCMFGCEKSDDATAPQPDQPVELSGTVGAAGGTLTSADGRLSITIPAGALGADTDLSIKEIDEAGIDPAFGDFSAHAALEMEPANLNLTAPAEISFSFAARPVPLVAAKARDFQEYPILIGVVRTADGNMVPSQSITYDLDPAAEHNFTITAELLGWSQLVVGNPADPSAKDNGYTKLTLEAEFKLDDDETVPLVEDTGSEFNLFIILRGGGDLVLSNPVFGNVPGQWAFYSLMEPGSPWEPEEVEELPESRLKYGWVVELYPGMAGGIEFTTGLEFDLEFLDIPDMHLPIPEGATVGQTKVHLRAKPVGIVVREQDPAPPALSIATGMTAPKGLNVSFESFNDPAPLGNPTDPWLYVSGLEGVRYYRLVRNQSQAIVSTELVGAITSLENLAGVLPISGQGTETERCLFMYGEEEHNYITYWNRSSGEYGMVLLHAWRTPDAVAYGNINLDPGFSTAMRSRVEFLGFNPLTGRFEGPAVGVSVLYSTNFAGINGDIVTCIVHDTSRATLLVTSSGQIWWHGRQDVEFDGYQVGSAQSSPRQIRGAGDFYAVSNSGASTLTTFLWGGGSSISNISNVSVGTGPVGIDVHLLPDSSYLVASTSTINNNYTLSHFNPAGGHIRNRTYSVPAPGLAPKYAIFVGSTNALYVALSCFDSGTVEIIPVDMSDFY